MRVQIVKIRPDHTNEKKSFDEFGVLSTGTSSPNGTQSDILLEVF